MKKMLATLLVCMLSLAGNAFASGGKESGQGQYIRMYYPVGVAGPLSTLIEGMVADFNKSQTAVRVESVFAGGYTETLEKTRTAFMAGNPPELAILDAPNLLDMLGIKGIIPLDDYIKSEGAGYYESFTPGFWEIAKYDGKIWSLPWQRSTPLFYYNKEFFKEAGLDPETPPRTWDEVASFAQKLVKRDAQGKVTRWGVEIPIAQWLMKLLVLQAGGTLDSQDGRKMAIDTAQMREALAYMRRMVVDGSMPAIKQWAEGPSDFAAGATAMLYNSTGALSFIASGIKYDFGSAYMPSHTKKVVIEGGGNFFIFKTNEARQKAAWTFAAWMVKPENTARFSIGSGYIPVRKAAFELPLYVKYVTGRPQALVAYKQLMEIDVQRNMMVYQLNALNKVVNTLMQEVLSGADVEKAVKGAQAEANAVLKDYQ